MPKPESLDHLVYATGDLDATVAALAESLGVEPTEGGQHLGVGTRNWLLRLSERSYLEVIGPDPEQPEPSFPRPFGIDDLAAPKLATWAIKSSDLEGRARAARAAGYDPGRIEAMSRKTPDGTLLEWRLTRRKKPAAGGLVPFLIDWGTTPGPATTSAAGCELVELVATHPEPAEVRPLLAALDVELELVQGREIGLRATLDTPRGRAILS